MISELALGTALQAPAASVQTRSGNMIWFGS
jgi:hypothetical protein